MDVEKKNNSILFILYITMITLILLIIFNLLFVNNISADSFTLGYLYHDFNYDLSIAFKYAVARHNMFTEDNVYFKANMLEITQTDLYGASRKACNMTSYDDGVVAIFGPESVQTIPMVQSVCTKLEIPHLQISWRPSMTYNTQTVLNFYPDTDLLAQGIATIIHHLQWKNFVILYQHNEGLLRLQEVLKKLKSTDTPITVRQLDANKDYRSILKNIKQLAISEVLVDCDVDVIIPLLQQAKEVDFLDYLYKFFFTSLDTHTLDFSELDTNANITTIRIVDPENPVLHNAVRDWEVGELNSGRYFKAATNRIRTEAALMHDAVNLFMTTLTELHITQPITTKPLFCNDSDTWSDGYRLVVYMKVKEMLNTVTGPIKFNEEGKRVGFRLQLAEIIRNNVTVVALWNSERPNDLEVTRTASEHSQQIIENLQKTLVIVSSRIGSPYLMWRERRYPGEVLEGNSQFEGYSLDLIDAIAQELNFTYKFVLTADNKYGNFDQKTQSWNGLIKDLLDRKAHLAICDLTITHARRQVVDFSMPFMTLGISILYRKAKEEERSIFAFMDPLETEVWLYIGTAYISLTVIIYLIARMAPGDWERPHPCDQDPNELENIWTLKNCLWLLLGSTMSQGCDILPKGISSRMATSMWWFLILIINSSYTANLAAFLTMERMGPTIDSAEALAKQTKIKYGVVKDGATEAFFRDSNYTTYKKMWSQMTTTRPSVFESNNGDGVKRVLTTKHQLYAFLMESSSIEYEIERNCELKRVGNRLDSKGYGIAMPMNSPYRGEISKVVLKLQENGKLNLLKKKWWKEMHGGGACDEVVEEKNDNELALDNVGGIFLVLGVGLAIAFGFAIIEFLWNVRKLSVDEHLSYWEALIIELKFAVNVTVTKKRVKPQISEKSSTSSENGSESKSIAQHLRNASSFLHLEVFDKISINRKV